MVRVSLAVQGFFVYSHKLFNLFFYQRNLCFCEVLWNEMLLLLLKTCNETQLGGNAQDFPIIHRVRYNIALNACLCFQVVVLLQVEDCRPTVKNVVLIVVLRVPAFLLVNLVDQFTHYIKVSSNSIHLPVVFWLVRFKIKSSTFFWLLSTYG